MELDEWTEIFLKHRSSHQKGFKEFTKTGQGFRVMNTDGSAQEVFVAEELFFSEHADIIVCLNTARNLARLVAEWSSFVKKNPLLVFAWPKTNEKWLVKPAIHDRITETESLEQGLQSMAQSIGMG